ncbi:hypothetical protein HID58_017079 [Brassica napus]|uniref:(rape) hypothetical protein n=2 Tax=Brassica TaxID=3705 RepID=A0A816T9F3_BRANA|nr:hypothetical protein HID58_017079 [Brassica napus]CAF2094118.1 unnamed protein product [Brassica napus]
MSGVPGLSFLGPKSKNAVVAGGLTAFVFGVYFYTMKAVGGTDELQMAIDKFEDKKQVETDPKGSGNDVERFLPFSPSSDLEMEIMPRENENALSAPTPMELGPGPYGKQRTSSLEAPIMLLTGHPSAVYTMKFNPSGTLIASGSHDREIFLWRVHGDCKNFMVLKGHKNAILDLHWTSDGSMIVSASPDKTVRAWDVETGKQVKKMAEHSSFVNSCCPTRRGLPLIISGSDDGTAKLWDLRQRGAIQTFPDKYQITAVSFSDAADKIFTGGVDNDVKVWDLRKGEATMTLEGHQDTITGMSLSPDGSYLLTNGMDNKLCVWDMRPYAPQNRCVKVFEGHQHNFEKNLLKCSWSPDGTKVTAGSADRMVHIWDTTTRRILYKLPGHKGSVNECVFHPSEPIIGSCSSDKDIYLGEI